MHVHGEVCHFHSLIPRPLPPPILDHLQYANTMGEGLGDLVMCGAVPNHYDTFFTLIHHRNCERSDIQHLDGQ